MSLLYRYGLARTGSHSPSALVLMFDTAEAPLRNRSTQSHRNKRPGLSSGVPFRETRQVRAKCFPDFVFTYQGKFENAKGGMRQNPSSVTYARIVRRRCSCERIRRKSV